MHQSSFRNQAWSNTERGCIPSKSHHLFYATLPEPAQVFAHNDLLNKCINAPYFALVTEFLEVIQLTSVHVFPAIHKPIYRQEYDSSYSKLTAPLSPTLKVEVLKS